MLDGGYFENNDIDYSYFVDHVFMYYLIIHSHANHLLLLQRRRRMKKMHHLMHHNNLCNGCDDMEVKVTLHIFTHQIF